MPTNDQALVFFDVDNTLFDGYTQKHLARYLRRRGILSGFDMLLVGAWFALYTLKAIKDEESGINFLLSKFKGWSAHKVDALFDAYFAAVVRPRLYERGIAVARDHIAKGDTVVLISTSLFPIIERVGAEIGTSHIIATRLAYAKGRMLGYVAGRAVTNARKVSLAEKTIKDRGAAVTYYYADHYTDYPLLKLVDNPRAVNPDKTLKRLAQKHSWPIVSFA